MADLPDRRTTWQRRGLRAEQRELIATLQDVGKTPVEIAAAFQRRYRLSALAAMRRARDWSQFQAADAWNRLFPYEPKTLKNFSYWENWRAGSKTARMPDLGVLEKLAQVYECRVSDLVTDCGDYRPKATGTASRQSAFINLRLIEAAFGRAEELEQEVARRWPRAWSELDRLRSDPPGAWPAWCLLPSAATAMVVGARDGDLPVPVAAVAALYAWRCARSVYVLEPERARKVMAAGVDELDGIDSFVDLPEWCVFIAGDRAEWAGAGLWAHLDYHANTGRPELRLLIDLARGGLDTLVSIPVLLDRPNLTEALGDLRAGLLGKLADVRAGQLDGTVSTLADTVERLVALVAYVAGSEADICTLTGSAARPARTLRPARTRTVWTVR